MKQDYQTGDPVQAIGATTYQNLERTLRVSTQLADSKRGAYLICKNVPESYLERTVLDLVRYMWNLEPDEENPYGLINHVNKEVAEICSSELDKALTHPSKYEYLVCSVDQTYTKKPDSGKKLSETMILTRLDLDKKMSEYSDRVIYCAKFVVDGKVYENHRNIQLVVLLKAQRRFKSRFISSLVYSFKTGFYLLAGTWQWEFYNILRPSNRDSSINQNN